jgi:hypothetical protein
MRIGSSPKVGKVCQAIVVLIRAAHAAVPVPIPQAPSRARQQAESNN